VPKRTFWLVTGAALGAGSSLWAERKVRQSLQQATARLQPDAIVVEVGRSARQAAGTASQRVRAAVATGRTEMLRREEQLWAELADHGIESGPPVPVPPPVPVVPVVQPSGRGRPRRRPSRRTVRAPRMLTTSAPDPAQ
jgi:hypothetical protein